MLCKRLTIPLTEDGAKEQAWVLLAGSSGFDLGVLSARCRVGFWVITCTAGHSRRMRKHEGDKRVCVFRGQKSGSIGLCGAYVCSPTLEGRSNGRGARCFHSSFSLWGLWNALGGFVGITRCSGRLAFSPVAPLHSLTPPFHPRY